MADIKLTRPAAGQYVVIPSTPDARMVLDFSADQVSIDRPQGSDSLFFRFEDGSGIELQNFYAQYSKEDIPSFEIDGQLIAGADFFSAFGPDLIPAAGPAASATRAARYADLTNSNLIDGVKHLDGLDIALDFGGKTEPILDTYASPFLLSNSAPSLSTGGGVISMNITEAGVGKPHMAPLTGSFTASDPDGDSLTATVTMGDTSVAINGVTRIVNNYGTLIITPVGNGSNVTYQYSYEVNDNPVDPLFKATDPRTDGADSLAQGESHTEVVTITVRDSMGHVVTQSINITITGSNDAPDIRSFDDMTLKDDGHFAGVHGVKDATNAINPAENAATENGGTDGAHHLLTAVGTITAYDPDHGAVLTYGINTAGSLKDASGHDSSTTFTVESYTAPANGLSSPTSIQGCDTQIKTEYGTLYLNSSTGKYEFVVDSDSSATNKLAEGQSVTLSFMPTVTDEHGAVDNDFSVMRNDGTPGGGANGINITIMGSNDVPVIQSAGWTAGNVVTEDSNAYLISGKVVGTDVDANETSTLRYGFFHPDGSESGSGTLENTLYVVASGTASDGSPQYSLSTSAPADGNFYGKLAIDQSSGNYSFELNNAASCVQALDNDADKGSSLGVTFPVVVKDDFGAYSTQNVSLTINGVNDAPQFLSTGSASYAVTVKDVGVYAGGDAADILNSLENDPTLDGGVGDGQHKIEAHGNIVINDVDNGDNTHTVWGVTTASGQVQVGAQSTAMGAGKATTTFYVLADDSVTTETPKDNNYYGTLTVKDDGSYSFKANTTTDSPVDKMGENATPVTITINLYANDGQATTTSSLSITIKGSNDAPTVDTNRWAVHDDGNPLGVTLVEAVNKDTSDSTVSGTFVAKDVDVGDTLHYGITTPASASQLAGGTTMYSKLYVVMKNDECKTVADPPSAGTYSADSYVGEFKLTETGSPATGSSYSFTLYNGSAAVQGLQEGVNKTASVTLVAQDNNGAYVKQDVSVTIKGSNDTPTVTPPAAEAAAMSVVESGVYQVGTDYNAKFDGTPKSEAAANTFTVSDVDNGDNQTVSITIKGVAATMQGDGNGKYTIDTPEGTFTLTAAAPVAGTSGSSTTYTYSYALDNDRADTQSLNAGEERNYTFTVTVTDRDGKGATTHQDITLKITGTNDKPILQLGTGAGPLGTAAHETGENTPIIGSFTVTDVDADGASLNGSGLTDLTNHKISLSLDSSSAVKSGVALSPDAEVSKVSGGYHEEASITTNYGVLTVKPDGTYSFTPKADFLDKDDQVNLKFNVTVTDRHDANDTKTISVTLKGENDDPTGGSTTPVDLAVVESGESYGDGGANYYNYVRDTSTTKNPSYMGKDTDGSSFTVKDVDANDTQKVSLLLGDTAVTLVKDAYGDLVYQGEYGKFIITPSGANSNKDGSYTPKNVGAGITYTYKYVLDDAKANSLGAKDDIDYKFKVVVTDSNTATTSQGVNVHVDAVNDIPRISWSSVGVSEAGLKNGNNTFADTGLATGQIPGGYTGGVYDPDNATNTLTFKVAGLTDGQNSWGVVAGNANGHGGAQLARNITGTDESGASITRAETVSILGQYSATEDGVAHQIIVTNYGVLNLNTATGSYTFNIKPTEAMLHDLGISDANIGSGTILNNINHLAQGEKLSFSFQATVTDPGNLTGTHMIGINIAGTNDKPALTLGYASTLVKHTSTTDTAGIAYEQLEIRDVKNNSYGAVTDTQRGYTLGNATSTDADAHSKAYFGAVKGHVTDGSGTLTEAGIANSAINTAQSSGTSASTNYVTVTGDYGTLKIDANGNYSYTMDKTMASKGGLINKLTASQHLDDSFTVLVKDEYGAWTTKAITVRIDGVNDNPYLLNSKDISGTVTESGNGYTTGSGSSLAYHGNATVESSATVNNVATAGTDTIIGKFHVADDDSTLAATTPFKLNPSAANTGLVGTDTDDWATYKTIYGYFHLNPATGDYKFKLDNTLDAVQELKQGDSRTVKIPVAVSDGNGGTLKFDYTLTVQGTNDKPELSLGTATLDVTDQTPTKTTAISSADNATVKDPDDIVTGDSKTITYGIMAKTVTGDEIATPATSTSVTGKWGTFSIDPKTGQYTYTIAQNNADVISLGENDKPLSETFKVAVVDNFGAFSTKDVTVFIHGHDDTTFISTGLLVPNGAVTDPGTKSTSLAVAQAYGDEETGHKTVSGKIGATDADSTDLAALKTVSSPVLQYHIVTNGNDYSLENVADGNPISIKMSHGTLVVSLNPDVDKDGALFKYDYTVTTTDSAVEALTSKDPGLTDEFTVKVVRGAETEASSTATITIHGVNDRPTIEVTSASDSNSSGMVTEDTLMAIGKVVATDPDNDHGGAFTFSLVTAKNGVDTTKLNDAIAKENPAEAHLDSFFNLGSGDMVAKGTYGYLVINQTGGYEYHRYPTNSSDYKNLNYLNTGESVNDTFYVRVRDEQGAYSQIKPVTVTLNGTNDKGSLENAYQAVTEMGVVQGRTFHSNELSFTDAKDANGNIIYLGANNSNAAAIKTEYAGKLSVHDDDNTGYTKFTPTGDLTITDEHGSKLATFSSITVGKNTLKGYGELTLDADGTYSFKPDQSSLNYLNVSNTLTLSLGVESTSDAIHQEKVSGNLSIAIHGTNDAPVVAINASGLDKNDFTTLSDGKTAIQYLTTHQDLASSFLQHASDDMQSDFAKWLGAFVPSWGKSDAKWQAVWDTLEKKIIDSLVKSDKLDDFLSDLNQANAVKNFLHDKVDDNILVDTEVAKRDGTVEGLKVTGNLNQASIVTDVDNAREKLTFFAVDDKDPNDNVVKGSLVQHISGKYGTLVVQADGNYTYMLNRESSDYQSLEKDAQESFKIYVRDPGGAVAEKTINLIVNVAPDAGSGSGSGGTGNAMALISTATSAVVEDKNTYVEGSVRVIDSKNSNYDGSLYLVSEDDSHQKTIHTTISDDYGTITLLPDGSYTYTLNNDNPTVQSLASNETKTIQYTVENASAQKSTIFITITGTNDAPYVLSEVKASGLYQDINGAWHKNGFDGAIASDGVEGTFSVKDIDTGDMAKLAFADKDGKLLVSDKINGTHGTYKLTPQGDGEFKYSYTPNGGDYVGEATDSVDVYISDQHGGLVKHTLSVTLEAKNNEPDLTVEDLTVNEDSRVLANVKDKGAADDSGKEIVLSGSNTLTYAVEHSGATRADGAGLAVVPTNGLPGIAQGQYGTLLLNYDTHNYEYRLNNDSIKVQQLGVGQTVHDKFTVTVTDAGGLTSSKVVDVTINGTNDVPSLSLHSYHDLKSSSGTGASLYIDNDNITVHGTAIGLDEDANDTGKLTYSVVAKDSSWEGKTGFVLDSGQLRLSQDGETSSSLTKQDVFIVEDSHGKWQLWDGQSTSAKIIHLGTFSLESTKDGNADYTFTGDKDGIAHLGQGESFTVNAEVSVSDGHTDGNASLPLQITVTGTNDAPEIKDFTEVKLVDNGSDVQTLQGNVGDNTSDVDGDKLTYYIKSGNSFVTTLDNEHGSLELDQSTGAYTFTMHRDFQADFKGLGITESVKDTFTVVAVDSYGIESQPKDLNIILQGRNDAPIVDSYTASLNVAAQAGVSQSGHMVAHDVDVTDTLDYTALLGEPKSEGVNSWDTSIKGQYGSLTIDAKTGDYAYTADSRAAALGLDSNGNAVTGTEHFTVRVSDGHNGIVDKSVDVTVTGVNDTPELTVIQPGIKLVENGDSRVASGTFAISDPDSDGKAQTLHIVSSSGNSVDLGMTGEDSTASIKTDYGTLGVKNDGSYTFTLDNDSPSVEALNVNSPHTESFTVTTKDSHGASSTAQTISVEIRGVNDAPKNLTVAPQTENSGTLHATDVDAGDSLHYVIVQGDGASAVTTNAVDGSYGHIAVNSSTGEFTYTANHDSDAYKALAGGVEAADSFKVVAVDSAGDHSNVQELTFHVTGDNHAPEAVASTAELNVADIIPGTHLSVQGDLAAAHDADNDALSYSVTGHNSTGAFTSGATESHTTILGEFGSLIFDAHSSDDSQYHYTYALDSSEEGMIKLAAAHADGSSLADVFSYSVNDGHGGVTTSSLVVSLSHDSSVNANGSIGHSDATSAHLLFDTKADDTLYGGASNDFLSGGEGDDTLYGGGGHDYLFGGLDKDHLDGGLGNDHLYGGTGNDNLEGGAGNDFLDGGTGTNTLAGGDGNDILVHHDGDVISGGSGIDVLLTDNPEDDLSKLLDSSSDHSVEVAIKATDADPTHSPLSLTDSTKLAAVGISIDGTAMTLSEKWAPAADASSSGNAFNNANDHLALSTNLAADTHDSSSSTEVAKFILNNS